MRGATRIAAVGALLVVVLFGARIDATTYASLHLYQQVDLSDVIVVATVVDPTAAALRVDEVLKGRPEASIRLVDHIDLFARSSDRRLLVPGSRELLFLKNRGDAYAPLQSEYSRWPVLKGLVEAPAQVRRLGLPDYRRTITTLVHLQSIARESLDSATGTLVTALKSPDPHVRLWAAHTAYPRFIQPPAAIADAYLSLWGSGDPELRASVASAVIQWRLRRAAPMFAAALRDGDVSERASAARGLGGAGDSSFLGQLQTAAASDPSDVVRAGAVEGLSHLLGAGAMAELWKGANDRSPLVRRSAGTYAVRLARTESAPELRAQVRDLLELLSRDRERTVRQTARFLLSRLSL